MIQSMSLLYIISLRVLMISKITLFVRSDTTSLWKSSLRALCSMAKAPETSSYQSSYHFVLYLSVFLSAFPASLGVP